MPISARPFANKKFATVMGRRMAYIDEGAGDAIVFQHGNPTSSYLWRNVMPHCAGLGRLIACDLIGMGIPTREDAMRSFIPDRRHLLSALMLAPFADLGRASPAAAQSNLAPLQQPAERTRAAYFARARALRDQAVREGDQAYGAVVVRDGVIVGEGRNYVVLHSDPTAHAELLAVRDAGRRLGTRDLSDCDVYSTAIPCPMCQGALYWGRIRRVYTEGASEQGSAPRLGC